MNTKKKHLLDRLPWALLLAGSVLLGLAPFTPQPHLFEKLGMLFSGTLSRPIDIFDLIMHATLPVLLVLKIFHTLRNSRHRAQHQESDQP